MRALIRRFSGRIIWRRALGGGVLAGGLGLWATACGSAPVEFPDPYRLHPSPEAVPPSPEATEAPRPPRASPPPLPGSPAPYPYPTPELPEAGPFEAVGMVLLRGQPAAGLSLSVVNSQTYRNVRVETDEQGIYRAKGLATGSYFVHYYNDRDNFKVGYWKTHALPVGAESGAQYPAFDVYLVGMQNTPGMGASTALPARFEWEPYALALRYRYRVHNRGGPNGKPYFVSHWLDPRFTAFTYDGTINQKGMGEGRLAAGRYLWGVYWDAGQAGEGGNLYQDFIVRPRAPREAPPPADPPEEEKAPRQDPREDLEDPEKAEPPA